MNYGEEQSQSLKKYFLGLQTKACQAVGHKGHMPLIDQIRRGLYPSKYAPDEIQNSTFLPLMKKDLIMSKTCIIKVVYQLPIDNNTF